MSARAHGTDEPSPDDPRRPSPEPVEGVPEGASEAAERPTEPVDAAAVPDVPADVDAEWSDLVTRLREPSDPRGWAPDPEVEEAETHFVPPDPGPVLGGDPLLTMAWAAVIGVPLLVVVLSIAWRDAPTWLLQAAGVAFVAGASLLIWRMPHSRDDDDDDTGAVV